jgi:hypothetical protein
MLALQYRVLIAAGYLGLGGFLLSAFDFSPWWRPSWIHFGILLGWAAAGIAFDPFRFVSYPSPLPAGRVGRLVQQWSVLVLSVLILLPLIAWATRIWWFFPWLPWRSEAPYWATRELVVTPLFVICVRLIWPTLTLGRQLCILLALLLTNHVVLLLTYAGISGTPEYLEDGVTQDWFLLQLWFKLLVGSSGFSGLEIWVRRRVGLIAEP